MNSFLNLKWAIALLHHLIQRFPVHILHHNITMYTNCDKVIDRDNTGMLDGSQELTLLHTLGHEIGVITAQQRFNHHLTFEYEIFGQKYCAHAS